MSEITQFGPDDPFVYVKAVRRIEDLIAERDRLRAELADRDAEIAGLRESARKVLDVPASYDDFGNMIVSAEDRNSFITALSDALSRTSAQHRARIEAAGKRCTVTELQDWADYFEGTTAIQPAPPEVKA